MTAFHFDDRSTLPAPALLLVLALWMALPGAVIGRVCLRPEHTGTRAGDQAFTVLYDLELEDSLALAIAEDSGRSLSETSPGLMPMLQSLRMARLSLDDQAGLALRMAHPMDQFACTPAPELRDRVPSADA